MPDDAMLRPATAQEVAETLTSALQFDGREKARPPDEFMARITAERMVQHLELSGFVLMRRPPSPAHYAPAYRRS